MVGSDERRHIGILLFPGVEELDAVGPWEVLAFWAGYFADDGYAVTSLSREGGTVRGAKGLEIRAQHSFADAPPLDVLIHPGGMGTRPQLDDEEHLDWVRDQRRRVPVMASDRTGALVYARAGLLAGRPPTTHWASLDHLGRVDRSIEVRRGERFVDDGDVVTSAGVSAGIDMAVHLVARLSGPERAEGVCRGIEYRPEGC